MPTANTTSPSGAKARTKRRKPARRKAAAARKATTTRAAASNGTARWSTSDRPAAAFGDYAERALLIPVGATLIARDRVVSGVSDTFSIYSSPTKAQAQLRRFERRGVTARKRLEREVRKTRIRLERELRQRRRAVTKRFSNLEQRREELAK